MEQQMTHQHREPSQRAQATRSLRLAEQLRRDGRPEEYQAAIREHFDRFTAPRVCPVHRHA